MPHDPEVIEAAAKIICCEVCGASLENQEPQWAARQEGSRTNYRRAAVSVLTFLADRAAPE